MVRSLSEGQADLQIWWTVSNEKEKAFVFHPGPVFCNIFLADEINRASPKVQSALLQERTVDADGTSSFKKSMKPSASARRSWIIFSICAYLTAENAEIAENIIAFLSLRPLR
jgi:hypothetical protein